MFCPLRLSQTRIIIQSVLPTKLLQQIPGTEDLSFSFYIIPSTYSICIWCLIYTIVVYIKIILFKKNYMFTKGFTTKFKNIEWKCFPLWLSRKCIFCLLYNFLRYRYDKNQSRYLEEKVTSSPNSKTTVVVDRLFIMHTDIGVLESMTCMLSK